MRSAYTTLLAVLLLTSCTSERTVTKHSQLTQGNPTNLLEKAESEGPGIHYIVEEEIPSPIAPLEVHWLIYEPNGICSGPDVGFLQSINNSFTQQYSRYNIDRYRSVISGSFPYFAETAEHATATWTSCGTFLIPAQIHTKVFRIQN